MHRINCIYCNVMIGMRLRENGSLRVHDSILYLHMSEILKGNQSSSALLQKVGLGGVNDLLADPG